MGGTGEYPVYSATYGSAHFTMFINNFLHLHVLIFNYQMESNMCSLLRINEAVMHKSSCTVKIKLNLQIENLFCDSCIYIYKVMCNVYSHRWALFRFLDTLLAICTFRTMSFTLCADASSAD